MLAPLLRTRVPDTHGNLQARQFITQSMEELGWSVELDNFTQDTVIGEKTFHNIIATRNKNSPRRLGTRNTSQLTQLSFNNKYKAESL